MDFTIDLVIKIMPGIIAAFLASKWAVSKFYAEKSWERKEKAYTEIINSLYDLIRYFRIQKEDYGQGTGLSESRENEISKKYTLAYSSLSKATDIGSFYISTAAEKILTELRDRERLNYHEEPRFEIYEHEFQTHQKALDNLLIAARKDLRIKRT